MGCSKTGGNDSTEVHRGELINHKSVDGLVMSPETWGGIHLLRQGLSLVVVVAPAFNCSQRWIPCSDSEMLLCFSFRWTSVFCFHCHEVFCIHRAFLPFQKLQVDFLDGGKVLLYYKGLQAQLLEKSMQPLLWGTRCHALYVTYLHVQMQL